MLPAQGASLAAFPGLADVAAFLQQQGEAAQVAGIEPWRLILDPGLGFSKGQVQWWWRMISWASRQVLTSHRPCLIFGAACFHRRPVT